MLKKLRLAGCLLLVSSASGKGQSTAQRYAITATDVAIALRVAGVAVDPTQIRLQVAMTSLGNAPELEIEETRVATPGVLQLRLACKALHQCLPFFASVDLGSHTDALATQLTLRSHPAANEPMAKMTRPTLHAGQQATLLLESDHMRITLPVISIDSGGIGSEVRVASLDRKQTYHGTVTDPTVVRGALP